MVLDREDFEREKENGSYIGTIDYDQASEENAILYGWSHFLDESGFDIGDTVNITLQSGDQSREVSLPLAGAFGNTEGSWAVTEDTYRNLGFSGDSTGIIWVDCEQKDTESVQTALYNLIRGQNISKCVRIRRESEYCEYGNEDDETLFLRSDRSDRLYQFYEYGEYDDYRYRHEKNRNSAFFRIGMDEPSAQ